MYNILFLFSLFFSFSFFFLGFLPSVAQGGSGYNDERENTLNQLLVEMDGFNSQVYCFVTVLCEKKLREREELDGHDKHSNLFWRGREREREREREKDSISLIL